MAEKINGFTNYRTLLCGIIQVISIQHSVLQHVAYIVKYCTHSDDVSDPLWDAEHLSMKNMESSLPQHYSPFNYIPHDCNLIQMNINIIAML